MTRGIKRRLREVRAQAHDAGRAELGGIHREGDALFSTDGVALYAIPVPKHWPEEADAFEPELMGRPKRAWSGQDQLFVGLKPDVPAAFPDVAHIRPAAKPILTYCVSAKRLIAALKLGETQAFGGSVLLSFWGDDRLMEIRNDAFCALLMPMYKAPKAAELTWLPEGLKPGWEAASLNEHERQGLRMEWIERMYHPEWPSDEEMRAAIKGTP